MLLCTSLFISILARDCILFFFLMIRRPPRSTLDRSSAASDVYKRQFIINAICSILAIFIYSAFADRVSNDRIMIALLAISVIGIVIGLALLAAGAVLIAFPLFYLILNVPLLDIYNVHWATYVSSFYDTRAAKRVVPVLGTSARLAGIVAGLTIPLLNQHFAPTGIISLWMAALVVMALLTWLMPRLLHENAALTAGHPAANHDAGMTMQPRPSAAEKQPERSA